MPLLSIDYWLTKYLKAYTKFLNLIKWPSKPLKSPSSMVNMSTAGNNISIKRCKDNKRGIYNIRSNLLSPWRLIYVTNLFQNLFHET